MKIQLAQARRTTADVLIRFVCALEKPTAGGIGKTVGEIRAADAARAVRSAPRTTITACLGSQADCTTETVRRVGGAVARWLTGHNVGRADVDLSGIEALSVSGAVEALCEGLQLGAFRFDPYRSDKKRDRPVAVRLVPKRKSPTSNKTIARTAVIADAVNLARRWGHEPPNVINPVTLAARIVKLARRNRLKCRVLDDKQLVRMKANAIVQVGIASKTPARLIVLEHAGKPGTKNAKPVVLVGKAITFDTGGYSLKDKTGIVGMKYDKCGGMAVVGVMQAVAALKLKTPVVGIIAAAENMIAGNAYRPNDIVKTMSGKTVEIISTDAEGRMVLADALTYAQKQYKPRAIIDLATLTGGVVIALGSVRAGLFANNDALAKKLSASGDRVHERLWRFPLDDEYLELIKGDDSDLKNSGGRGAHSIIGAIFLKQFVDNKVPWAHLDIAGVGDCDKDQPYCPKGATGFGVRLLIDYLCGL